MPIETNNEDSNSIAKNTKSKKIYYIIIIILLLAISFASGMYLSGKNEIIKELASGEATYVGNVLNK